MPVNIDWLHQLDGARAWEGLDDEEPVPRAELVDQAVADTGYSEKDVLDSLRSTDLLELADGATLEDPAFVAANGHADTHVERTPDEDTRTPHVQDASDEPVVDESEYDPYTWDEDTYPYDLRQDGKRWLFWQNYSEPGEEDATPRKIPVNPARGPHSDFVGIYGPCANKAPQNWYEWGDVERWTDFDRTLNVGYYPVTPDLHDWDSDDRWSQIAEDPEAYLEDTTYFGLVDGDDVRDPDTGEYHPRFEQFLRETQPAFQEVSWSFTGAHVLGVFELPEGVGDTLKIPLPADEWDGGECEIELYAGNQFVALTGRQLTGCGGVATADIQHAIDSLLDEFDTEVARAEEAKRTSESYGMPELPDREDTEAFVESTDDIQVLLDALAILEPGHVYLESGYNGLEKPGWEEWDPAYRTSTTGRSLKRVQSSNIWIDMKAKDQGFRLVNLVAAEEGIIKDPWDRLAGEEWWQAVDAVRDRASVAIPVYEGTQYGEQAWDEWRSVGAGKGEKLPYAAMMYLAVETGLCAREELPFGEDDRFPAETFNAILDHVRELGFDPNRRAVPTIEMSSMPLKQLERADHHERRELAREAGVEWPTTDEAQAEMRHKIYEAMRQGRQLVLEGETAMGKSHAVSTVPWSEMGDVTGDQPVIHLHATKDARAEARERADKHHIDAYEMKALEERCPCARGDHDPETDDDGEFVDGSGLSVEGMALSEYMIHLRDHNGLPASAVHAIAEWNIGHDLPCQAKSDCPYTAQFDGLLRRDGEPAHDVVHATHAFLNVPSFRMHTHVLVDERPVFVQYDRKGSDGMSEERVRRAITAYLRELPECERHGVVSYEDLVALAGGSVPPSFDVHGDGRTIGGVMRHEWISVAQDKVLGAFSHEPTLGWYQSTPEAHTLAPALTRAIFLAIRDEQPNSTGRRSAEVWYDPPRLDADAVDESGWNMTRVRVVLTDDNQLELVHQVPHCGLAASVIGLDATPAMPLWKLNLDEALEHERVLHPETAAAWRRFERNLRVVQVGSCVNPAGTGGEYLKRSMPKWQALTEHLRESYGDAFSTAICPKSVDAEVREAMEEVGVDDPRTRTYGLERSFNGFAGETVGAVNGCIDPGDDYVYARLAALGCDAIAARNDTDCAECNGAGHHDGYDCRECFGTGKRRARGERAWDGEDAEVASGLLASVREHHVVQGIGRYARKPWDPEDHATVFVRSSAMPEGYAEVQVNPVRAYTSKQTSLVRVLREASQPLTAPQVATRVNRQREHEGKDGLSDRYVRKLLKEFAQDELVSVHEGVGKRNADGYAATDLCEHGAVDVGGFEGLDGTRNGDVSESYTWSFRLSVPSGPPTAADGGTTQEPDSSGAVDPPDEGSNPAGD